MRTPQQKRHPLTSKTAPLAEEQVVEDRAADMAAVEADQAVAGQAAVVVEVRNSGGLTIFGDRSAKAASERGLIVRLLWISTLNGMPAVITLLMA